MKKVTIEATNISTKQWNTFLIETNLMIKAWKPYAKLEIHAPSVNKIIKQGTRKYDARD